jgi:hypothetical protein
MQPSDPIRSRRHCTGATPARLGLLLALALLPLLVVVPMAEAASAPPTNDFHWDAPALYGAAKTAEVSTMLKGPSGSVYAVGRVGYTMVAGSICIERLNSTSGALIWRKIYTGYQGRGFQLQDAVSDAKGNVTIVGGTLTGNSQDWQVVRFSPVGKALWVRLYDGPAHATDIARAVAVDSSCNSYVCGIANVKHGAVADSDTLVIKYDAAGKIVWKYLLLNTGGDEAPDIAVDAARNSYVCVNLSTPGGRTCSILKLHAAGTRWWRVSVIGDPAAVGWVQTIKLSSTSVYVIGIRGLWPTTVTWGAKYSLAGGKRWISAKDFDGADYVATGTVDLNGNLIVVGWASGSTLLPSGDVGTLVKWSSASGIEAWSHELAYWWGGGGSYSVRFDGISTDSLGRILCAGSMTTATGTSAMVMRYPAGGTTPTRYWEYRGSGTDYNAFSSLLRLSDWQIYAGGSAQSNGALLVQGL